MKTQKTIPRRRHRTYRARAKSQRLERLRPAKAAPPIDGLIDNEHWRKQKVSEKRDGRFKMATKPADIVFKNRFDLHARRTIEAVLQFLTARSPPSAATPFLPAANRESFSPQISSPRRHRSGVSFRQPSALADDFYSETKRPRRPG